MAKRSHDFSEQSLLNKEKLNKSISSSIAGIIRVSVDSSFRDKCYSIFQVDNTNDLEVAVKKKLDILSHVTQTEEPMKANNIKKQVKVQDLEVIQSLDNVSDGKHGENCEELLEQNSIQENQIHIFHEAPIDEDIRLQDTIWEEN